MKYSKGKRTSHRVRWPLEVPGQEHDVNRLYAPLKKPYFN